MEPNVRWNIPGFNAVLDNGLIPLSEAFPLKLIGQIQKEYDQLAKQKGYTEAEQFLEQLDKEITSQTFDVAIGNDGLVIKTKSHVERFQRLHTQCLSHDLSPEKTYQVLSSHCQRIGIEAPTLSRKITFESAIRRMVDKSWIKRQLRIAESRRAEAFQIAVGAVHKHASLYVSQSALVTRQEQIKNNNEILEATTLINELDQEFTLKALSELNLANPRNRYCEMMARIAGYEKHARGVGLVSLFITITCPSRMHARLHKTGYKNPHYDGTNPRQANQYLNTVWKRTRSKLRRDKIPISGMRVVEPQHDGTPHWHLLLFCRPEHQQALENIIRHYALQDSPDEKGAKEHRCTFEYIDYERGTATGYIAKYLSKNITGEHIETDTYGNEAKDTVERVDAWASLWGIRQFQSFGGPTASVWRELRRVDSAPDGIMDELRQAADAGDYQRYIDLSGGVECDRASRPISLAKVWSDEPGKYGEPKGNQVIGVTDGLMILPTRVHEWRVKGQEGSRVSKPESAAGTSAASLLLGVL